MAQAGWKNVWLKLEDWRLRQHFKRVEKILRKSDTSHLPETLQKARKRQIETLHRYAERAIFPRNHSEKSYTPCFIDKDGRECAVAHLLMKSEQNELVQSIVQNANYAYVPEMKFPELEQWADESGLTREDVALIQPGYWATFGEYFLVSLGLWFVGINGILFNLLQLSMKKKANWGILGGIILGLPIALLALLLLFEALIAYNLGTDPDGYPYDKPLEAVPPLLLAGLFSLALAALVVWLPFYRRKLFSKAKRS